ncbi:MAG: M56 family metallopeptidase [Lachnospiraceae bacterium]|nr:M56 family metallopeptidase [Lachnospiraceae bacterium]
MLHFGMNMPYYLMMIYGSVMIVMVLILRMLFRNRLPKFVFPVLWCVVLLRFLIPFSVSSPLSIPMPWNILSPIEITYSSSTAVSEAVLTDMPLVEAVAGDMAVTVVEDSPVVNYVAGDEWYGQTVGYDNVSIAYDPVKERISVKGDSVNEATEAYGGISQTAYSDYYPSYGSVLGGLFSDFDVFYKDIFMVRRLLVIVYILGFIAVVGILGLQKYRYLKRLRSGLLIEHNETVNTMLRDMGMGYVLVFTSDEIASPMVCGLLNPRIYLPTQMDFQNTTLLRHVLSHETMHIRRKDNWLKCLMLIMLCLNWFNPLVWIMAKCLASDLEAACDAAVLKQCDEDTRKEYAVSLLAMAVSASRMPLLYSAFSKTEVEKRVKNVLSYKKMTFLAVLFTVLLMAGSMTAFASIGQAPFWTELTAFCSSDNSRWGVDVSITRDIALGENAQERAEDVVFSVLRTDETGDPKVLEDRIQMALAQEFGVERGAFRVETSFIINDEEIREEYEPWGLSAESGNAMWNYQGETIRTYEDKMIGHYQSNAEGTVDVFVQRNECGEITAVEVWHEGDPEYDERTRRYEQHKTSGYGIGTAEETILIQDYR